MDQLGEIASKIYDLVNASDEKSLLGVRLGLSLRNDFPAFSPSTYQCRSLRQFIRKHVPKVSEKGSSGADVIYTVSEVDLGRPLEPTRLVLPTDPATWKAFSNPSYPFTVVVNPDSNEVKAISVGERAAPPWVDIPKCSGSVHLEIAKEFVASLPMPSQASLARMLTDPKWYVRFFAVTNRMGLGTQWGLFKRQRLIDRFKTVLEQHGISTPAIATMQMPPVHSYQSEITPRELVLGDDVDVRELVRRLIEVLPVADLRSLRVPVGVVFDALTKR